MMMPRRFWPLVGSVLFCVIVFFYFNPSRTPRSVTIPLTPPFHDTFTKPKPDTSGRFKWATRKENHPVPEPLIQLPKGNPLNIPRIQFAFNDGDENAHDRKERLARRDGIKKTFTRTWEGYKNHAWMKDELMPVSGGGKNYFGGWAATLIDSLDTLWIMDKRTDFDQAVANIGDIDFSSTEDEELNVFETTIRYLGGLISAYELSNQQYPVLLEKAIDLGNLLYAAFDTPNRMPITRWKWQAAKNGEPQQSNEKTLVAEIGSLFLEFTKLSQITGDSKYYDAVARVADVFEKAQGKSKMPGMWPISVNPQLEDLGGDTSFTIGAMADSLYEYFPKMYVLLGGLSDQYKKMYESSMDVVKKHLLFRPMTPTNEDILFSGNIHLDLDTGERVLDPQGQHLACFAGGMFALGSKVFEKPDDMAIARKLTEGCVWAYKALPTGIMPEFFYMTPCANATDCRWDPVKADSLPDMPGIKSIPDPKFHLRPEAIESLFLLYRMTGDKTLLNSAWTMFEAIEGRTRTQFGNAALIDVTKIPPEKNDRMESFWTAETLKYFYLMFSEPNIISLDEWVFNTEAHPFRRPGNLVP